MSTDVAYVALGSNIGDRGRHLAMARKRLAALPGTCVLAASAIDETAPLGDIPQGRYLNQMVALETTLSPHALLAELHRIEADAGRTRRVRWAPRTLDLDIVLLERQEVHDDSLTVPHPELPRRPFWLRELDELRACR